jgi:protein tyrosine phosphatase (PTP) superfamily phosphohydrolase (DUF442 family)
MAMNKNHKMDISKINDYLYVSSKPQAGHVEELTARNICLIICMIGGQRPPDIYAQPAFRLLWLQTCDSILTPIPMRKLMDGVQAALPVIQRRQSILVYCAKGRHRSVAMAAAILIAMGSTTCEAMELLRVQRMVADPRAWHISRRIQKFERLWRNGSNQPAGIMNRVEETYAEIATTFTSNAILFITTLGPWILGKPHIQPIKKQV